MIAGTWVVFIEQSPAPPTPPAPVATTEIRDDNIALGGREGRRKFEEDEFWILLD